MRNSATGDLNTVEAGPNAGVKRFFYSSSAWIYPERSQLDLDNPNCVEESAYPAAPDSKYGRERLFSELLFFAYAHNYGLEVHVARFHNIFRPQGTWSGGGEKTSAAICRRVLRPRSRRDRNLGRRPSAFSFLYIDEYLEGVRRLMESSFQGQVKIGSQEMVTINQLA
jgi:nucleoside-diphosphate-sugar epimerase